MGLSLVQKLAGWALSLHAEDMAPAALTQAKLFLLDTLGCGLAALDEDAARAVLAALADMGGAPQCTIIGGARKTSVPNAVLVNGALIRILDLNDYVNTAGGQIGGHPSDNIPVALAAGEAAGAGGRAILVAIVAGYEVYGRMKELMDDDGDWDGVTASGFVAPVMAGRLFGLDAERLAHALALSGARSATPLAVRAGAISAAKSIANALVAQNGAQATILARHGMTGPLDLFENRHGLGLLFPHAGRTERLFAPLADAGYIMGCHMKAFPCLATGQSIVAAGLELHRQIGGDVDRLARITVAISDQPFLRRQKDDPGRIDPKSREAADHSFNFLAAVSLLDGEFGLKQFERERWNDPQVRAVMARLGVVCDPALNARSPGGLPCLLQGLDRTGETHEAFIPDPPGFSRDGLQPAAVVRKFNAITSNRLSECARARIVEAAMTLDHSPSCHELTAALAAAAAELPQHA